MDVEHRRRCGGKRRREGVADSSLPLMHAPLPASAARARFQSSAIPASGRARPPPRSTRGSVQRRVSARVVGRQIVVVPEQRRRAAPARTAAALTGRAVAPHRLRAQIAGREQCGVHHGQRDLHNPVANPVLYRTAGTAERGRQESPALPQSRVCCRIRGQPLAMAGRCSHRASCGTARLAPERR